MNGDKHHTAFELKLADVSLLWCRENPGSAWIMFRRSRVGVLSPPQVIPTWQFLAKSGVEGFPGGPYRSNLNAFSMIFAQLKERQWTAREMMYFNVFQATNSNLESSWEKNHPTNANQSSKTHKKLVLLGFLA